MPKVTIRCEEVVVYHKTIDVSDQVVADYMAAVDRDESDKWFHAFAERYIDPLVDVSGGRGYDDVELTVLS